MPGAQFYAPTDPGARRAYADVWEASAQRTVFAHPEALDAVGAAFGLNVRLALTDAPAGDGGATASAAAPVFEKRRAFLRAAALPPLVPVVSPLLATPPDEHEVHARRSPLDALLARLAGHYHQASFLLHPSLVDHRPFLWAGWQVVPRYTYDIDLSGTHDLLRDWSPAARRTARRGADAYRLEEGEPYVDVAVALMEEAYARRGASLGADGQVCRALARAFVERGLARVVAAVPAGGGPPEAAIVVAHDGRTAHYWIAGSQPGPAMTVLLGGLLPRLRADGLTRFDLVGANTPSIAEFKRRFGPRLQPYARARIGPWRRR